MKGADLSAVSVSGLIPVLRWLKYASRRTKVRLPIVMKMNPDKCSIDRLCNARVKVLQVVQFISCCGRLCRALPFVFCLQNFKLVLHVLLNPEETAVKAGRLVTYNRSLPGRSLPSAQCLLGYPVRCWWSRRQSSISSYPAIAAVEF